MCSSLNWRCTITSSDCDVKFEWDALRDWVLRSSFPTLLHEVRADIVKHLAKGDDTLYSISKAIGHPIQSVMKALRVLTERGYVTCEYRESRRRRKVKANVCGLTELGRLAALALLDDIELEIPIQQQQVYAELLRVISGRWLKNEKLRNVYKEALMFMLAVTELERKYQSASRLDERVTPSALYEIAAIAAGAQAKVVVFESYKEFLWRGEEPPYVISYKSTVYEELIPTLKNKLERLMRCDDEVREILLETVKAYLKSDVVLVFTDYIHRLAFLGNVEESMDQERFDELIKELIAANRKIFEELRID